MYTPAMLAQSSRQTAGFCYTTIQVVVIVLSLSLPRSSSADGYVMQLQTTGSSFSPAAYIDGVPQTFLWNWSDGTTSTDYPIAAAMFGSSGSRTPPIALHPSTPQANM